MTYALAYIVDGLYRAYLEGFIELDHAIMAGRACGWKTKEGFVLCIVQES